LPLSVVGKIFLSPQKQAKIAFFEKKKLDFENTKQTFLGFF
jgi:hypothetical protein